MGVSKRRNCPTAPAESPTPGPVHTAHATWPAKQHSKTHTSTGVPTKQGDQMTLPQKKILPKKSAMSSSPPQQQDPPSSRHFPHHAFALLESSSPSFSSPSSAVLQAVADIDSVLSKPSLQVQARALVHRMLGNSNAEKVWTRTVFAAPETYPACVAATFECTPRS